MIFFRSLHSVVGIFVISQLLSCATILKEKTHKINVGTNNGKKVEVMVDGSTYTVPGPIPVTRAKEGKTIQPKNNECGAVYLESSVEPVFFVNILSGGTIGSAVDFSSGHMWKYQDNVTISCQ